MPSEPSVNPDESDHEHEMEVVKRWGGDHGTYERRECTDEDCPAWETRALETHLQSDLAEWS